MNDREEAWPDAAIAAIEELRRMNKTLLSVLTELSRLRYVSAKAMDPKEIDAALDYQENGNKDRFK